LSFNCRKDARVFRLENYIRPLQGSGLLCHDFYRIFSIRHNNRIFVSGNTNYGEGAKKIALINDLDFKEVKKFQHIWKSAIEETSRLAIRTAAEAERIGLPTSPFGRKRWFYTAQIYRKP